MRTWRLVLIALFLFLPTSAASAHCDTLDGPVVQAAKKALETGNVNLVLVWVKAGNEAEVREAFARTLAVRGTSAQVRTLADMYFFETLVRIHRAGEGEPYTGLKPADAPVEEGIQAADEALSSGSDRALLEHLEKAVNVGVHERFMRVMEHRSHGVDDVKAGREWVRAYVEFIHYVEGLQRAAASKGEHEH